jgi:hypothetical protein
LKRKDLKIDRIMKNILTFTILFFTTFLTCNSQNIGIGIKAGFGVTNTHVANIHELGVNSDFFSPILSYSLNGFLDYKSKGLLGFSIEPGVIKKGWNTN